jgi:putative transposase
MRPYNEQTDAAGFIPAEVHLPTVAHSMAATPYFTPGNTDAAYQLRFHFGWHTHRRRPLLNDASVRRALEEHLCNVAERNDYRLLESAIERDALYALLSLKPGHSPSAATRVVKGNLAAEARSRFGIRDLWSRGAFVRSVGAATNDTVRDYVARQFERHRALPADVSHSTPLARYHDAGDPSALRTSDHAGFEYNLHVVLVTRRRFEFLDRQVADALLDYWLRVCELKQWSPWDIEVLGEHAHLFLGARPSDSPQDVALSLMNNSAHFMHERYGTVLRSEHLAGVWQAGFYAGTVGSTTTAQVKAHLRRRGEE